MQYIFFPTKDASIYEHFPTLQTGLDEILEIGKSNFGNTKIRSLIGFDVTHISHSMATNVISPSSRFQLNLFIATGSRVVREQMINVYNVSSSWNEGGGYFYQDLFQITDGVTWRHRMSSSLWNNSGSDYITSTFVFTSSSIPIQDFTFDVTTTVREWISGNLEDNGFLLKYPDSDESDSTNKGVIKFFSRNTHTIYTPFLLAKWDDQVFSTGSLSGSHDNGDVSIVFKNIKKEYFNGETVRVDIAVRDLYPTKTFSTVFLNHPNTAYLPQNSFFSVVDAASGVTILPFSEGSKVSTDTNGSYITFTIQNMYKYRYYKILLKCHFTNVTRIFDSNILFTVE